ncbi:hypothetical protein [Streptomyces sp. NPDC003032]
MTRIASPRGQLKVGCAKAVEKGFPGRALILDPGMIIGPHDRTRRATWWLRRAAQGGRMIAPGSPAGEMQLIDARDIAAFGLDRIEAEDAGTHLVTGTPANTTRTLRQLTPTVRMVRADHTSTTRLEIPLQPTPRVSRTRGQGPLAAAIFVPSTGARPPAEWGGDSSPPRSSWSSAGGSPKYSATPAR